MIARPAGGRSGGDLFAVYSCGEASHTRIVLADTVGHGSLASPIASHIHQMLHKFEDIRDTASLLAALNDEFMLKGQTPGKPLRLATVVTATFDRATGEFNYAYAGHPRMLEWRTHADRWGTLGEGLDGLPLGVFADEPYSEQSVRFDFGDMVLMFTDAVTEVTSPTGDPLTARGFSELASTTLAQLGRPHSLGEFAEALLDSVTRYHGSSTFNDDLTLLTLRRSG